MWALDRLSLRIFTVFLITFAFFLALIILLPKLDSRNLTYLSHQERENGQQLAHKIESELDNNHEDSFRWWLRFIIIMDSYRQPGQHFFILTPEEQVITSSSSFQEEVLNFSNLLGRNQDAAKKIYNDAEILGPFILKYNGNDFRLFILQPAKNLQSQFANMLFDYPLLLLSVTMLISTPLLLWLSWSLAKPARRLKMAADEVAKGNLQEWPELESTTAEFKSAGISFNHMLRELKRMQQLQQQLLSDISHELRTPLTRLKLAAALQRRKQGDSEELERIENESNRIDVMISELLSLSRKQFNNAETHDLLKANKLWQTVLQNAQFEAEQLHKKFMIIAPPPEVTIFGQRTALSSALENVIRNAFRYSYHRVEINFYQLQEQLIIQVDDDGPGVNEQEYTRIFQPFYRTSEARDRNSGGTGLGLAIVHNAITQARGTVIAGKSTLGGLRITITLPVEA